MAPHWNTGLQPDGAASAAKAAPIAAGAGVKSRHEPGAVVPLRRPPGPAARSDTDYLGQALRASHLAHGLDLLTDPWCHVILRAAFMGTRQFESFQQAVSIPRQTLSMRLAYLVRIGVLARLRKDPARARHEYRLTERGRQLYGNVLTTWAWHRRWGVADGHLPRQLVHTNCGRAFRPVLLCEHCDGPMTLRQVEPMHARDIAVDTMRSTRIRRWRGPAAQSAAPDCDVLAVIDDRWSMLVVVAAMLGASRFEQLMQMLQISSAVLTRRLQRLCALGVLVSATDPADRRRSLYRLGEAGQDLFAYVLCMSGWAGRDRDQPDTIGWIHTRCTKAVHGRLACSHCRQTLLPTQVTRPRH